MPIGRSRRAGSSSTLSQDGLEERAVAGAGETNGFVSSSSASSTSAPFSSSYAFSSAEATACGNYIQHRVSKMDTLAGVAIKYGVEVADIRRMNALVTDRQMFAHKTIKIPLPGRHPPSPIMSNGSACNGDQSPRWQPRRDLLESFQSATLKTPQRRVSPAMSSLQGYYGLVTPRRIPTAETEMAVYGTGRVPHLEDEPLPRASPISGPPPNSLAKSGSLADGFSPENGDAAQPAAVRDGNVEMDKSNGEKSIRRRQKVDADSPCRAPPEMPKEADGASSGKAGKGIAPRPKSGSRTDLDSGFVSAMSTGDSLVGNGLLPVRKSSSASNLQESDDDGSSSWTTAKWSLKPDGIVKPLFDGLPKPMAVWRSKAALD